MQRLHKSGVRIEKSWNSRSRGKKFFVGLDWSHKVDRASTRTRCTSLAPLSRLDNRTIDSSTALTQHQAFNPSFNSLPF